MEVLPEISSAEGSGDAARAGCASATDTDGASGTREPDADGYERDNNSEHGERRGAGRECTREQHEHPKHYSEQRDGATDENSRREGTGLGEEAARVADPRGTRDVALGAGRWKRADHRDA